MGTDVFISYSRQNKPQVSLLAEALEQEGRSVWWDPDILPGQHYQDVIQNALHDAGCVITVWTPQSVQSDYVRAESLWAFTKKNLISVKLAETIIPTPFNAIHVADLSNWQGDVGHAELKKLVRGIDWICAQNSEKQAVPTLIPEEKTAHPVPASANKLLSDLPNTQDSLSGKQTHSQWWLLLLGFIVAAGLAFYFLNPKLNPQTPAKPGSGSGAITKSTHNPESTVKQTPSTDKPANNGVEQTSVPPPITLAQRVELLLPHIKTAENCMGDFNVPEVSFLKDYIHKAASVGSIEGIQSCLDFGVSVNIQEKNDWTPLHSAAHQHQDEAVKFLLSKNADRSIKDKNGRTALDIARLLKAAKVIQLLE